jgi:pimeloyl-ACP methyl ester carboxylesterase
MTTAVVFVHGLWFTGREAWILRRRLARRLAARDCVYSYRSVRASMAENAAGLGNFLCRLNAETVHLVGHSLGGVVIRKLFEAPAPFPPGRIVLLGSPLNGSQAAEGFARIALGRRMLGRGIADEVLPRRTRRWEGGRDLGIIAGDSPVGLGRLVTRLQGANDGAVLVEETQLAGATDHLVMRVNHSGLLFDAAVADQTAAFLRDGRFARSVR